MKKLLLCLIIFTLPLVAGEIWLGMVVGAQGDSLLLVDGPKVYVPNLSYAQYISESDELFDDVEITFPCTMTLITDDLSAPDDPESRIAPNTRFTTIKIHKFYELEEGRLVERTSTD
ncbi:MAG: hypothetical protein WBB37_02865 [bacterium]